MKCCDLISKNDGFLKNCVIIMNELYFNKYCYNKATNMYSKNSQKKEKLLAPMITHEKKCFCDNYVLCFDYVSYWLGWRQHSVEIQEFFLLFIFYVKSMLMNRNSQN